VPANESPPAAIVGLTEADAQARLKADGFNELPRPGVRTPFRIVFEVLREPMMALLFARALFRFGPLHVDDLAVTIGAGAVLLLLLEVVKPVWWPKPSV
jgi:magnesium-transporting ATPase (P-type)